MDLTNLIEYWPLNESSGSRAGAHGGLTLSEVGGTINAGTGLVYANVADFEAADARMLRRASASGLEVGDIDFSCFLWVKLESIWTDNASLAIKGNGSSGSWQLRLNSDGPFAFVVYDSSGYGSQGSV